MLRRAHALAGRQVGPAAFARRYTAQVDCLDKKAKPNPGVRHPPGGLGPGMEARRTWEGSEGPRLRSPLTRRIQYRSSFAPLTNRYMTGLRCGVGPGPDCGSASARGGRMGSMTPRWGPDAHGRRARCRFHTRFEPGSRFNRNNELGNCKLQLAAPRRDKALGGAPSRCRFQYPAPRCRADSVACTLQGPGPAVTRSDQVLGLEGAEDVRAGILRIAW